MKKPARSAQQQEMQNSFNDKMRKMIINVMVWAMNANRICMRIMVRNVCVQIQRCVCVCTLTQHLNYFNNIFCLFEIRIKTMMSNDNGWRKRMQKKKIVNRIPRFMFNFSWKLFRFSTKFSFRFSITFAEQCLHHYTFLTIYVILSAR